MKKRMTVGIVAHVDAGKTTLSEALLYVSGALRRLGRVDRGDAFLDHHTLERQRGITIFSKQAVLEDGEQEITLVDTPGHTDFSAEMERALGILDYAILVVSGSEGVQAHTETLWKLLKRYRIPAMVFVNKMDMAVRSREMLLTEMKERLGDGLMDFTADDTPAFYEEAATAGEEELEMFLSSGRIPAEQIRERIRSRDIVPVWFGSALKNDGVREFWSGFRKYAISPERGEEFGARVYKIERDGEGRRLTLMKLTGGRIAVRGMVGEEKISGIRLYDGEKYHPVQEAEAGMLVAVTGLEQTRPGQGLGMEADAGEPFLEPVLSSRLILPQDADPARYLTGFRQLEEEIPELHIAWDEEHGEIHAQFMGQVQMEILQELILRRLGIAVSFGAKSVVYRETIASRVEGVGHFEPLRHYAEVHLLLEPGERGSGITVEDRCSTDMLAGSWHRLIMTHLREKVYRGVRLGAPLTDVHIALTAGRAHLKHTMGGDFRQAVYRAVRQGLMEAETIILEPYYRFRLEVPEKDVGRAMTDLGQMSADFGLPEPRGEMTAITGRGPVACLDGYQAQVSAFTAGKGRLSCVPDGYDICHNSEEVLAASGYDPEQDLRDPTGSVFCSHGAGFYVPWNEVKQYMHLESSLSDRAGQLRGEADTAGAMGTGRAVGADGKGRRADEWIDPEEVDAILARTYDSNRKPENEKRSRWGVRHKNIDSAEKVYRAKPAAKGTPYLLVDGYNVIYAWPELSQLAKTNMDSARDRLLDILCNYQGYSGQNLIAVFDAYRVQGHRTEYLDWRNIHVVYTKEAETADRYIERFSHEKAKDFDVTVVTSDGVEQVIIRGQGAALISSREFAEEVKRVNRIIAEETAAKSTNFRHFTLEVPSE